MLASRIGTILITLLIVVLVHAPKAQALTVAVFPVEDLSQGFNSPNIHLTRYLAGELAAKGLDLVDENDIISFMARERIRWLGYLDTENVLKTRKNLGAELILFGTITQQQVRTSPTFGLTLHLIRTRDAKTIWSSTAGQSLADMQKLLGLNEPQTLEDLLVILVSNVLADWPDDLGTVIGQPLIFDSESGEMPPTLQIKAINLKPRFVKPGEQVKCAIQLMENKNSGSGPQIFIKVGSRIHLAQQSQEGLFYEAAWTGSEIEKGIFREVGHEALKLAAQDLNTKYFEGVWPGPIEDDIYPVSLILRWPRGEHQEAFVGTYTVDSTPPDIKMIVKGRKIYDGLPTFRDHIYIMPNIEIGEPTSHWRISVINKNGNRVMGDEGKGRLPNKLLWKGQNSYGFKVEEGVYKLVLEVWDRAGNEMKTHQEVAYKPTPPDIELEVVKVDQSLQLNLDLANKDIPLIFWRMELWDDNGEFLLIEDGKELPVNYEVAIPPGGPTADNKIKGFVAMRDFLGNQIRFDIKDLYLMAMKDGQPDMQETSEAVKDSLKKDDSWAAIQNF